MRSGMRGRRITSLRADSASVCVIICKYDAIIISKWCASACVITVPNLRGFFEETFFTCCCCCCCCCCCYLLPFSFDSSRVKPLKVTFLSAILHFAVSNLEFCLLFQIRFQRMQRDYVRTGRSARTFTRRATHTNER